MARVKEEAKERGSSKRGGMGFCGLGVMRSEFRMRSGSRVRTEKNTDCNL